jgi:hypothetical protein
VQSTNIKLSATLLLTSALFCAVGCKEDSAENSRPETVVESADDTNQPGATASKTDLDGEPTPNQPGNSIANSGKATTVQQELPDLDEVLSRPKEKEPEEEQPAEVQTEQVQTIEIPSTWKRLSQQQEIWVDMKNKQVIAAGHICMNAGPLEVFVCPRHTKEHESVISVNALSSQIHAALLAVGAEPGHPVKWDEEYQPASGPVINISVIWKDEEQNQIVKRRGQEMVLNVVTGKVMQQNWVFGGSQVYTDPETGETFYYGDSGELVCLSNFSTATMDVPVKSSDANEGLLFAAHTPQIPDVGTKVYVVFEPVLE